MTKRNPASTANDREMQQMLSSAALTVQQSSITTGDLLRRLRYVAELLEELPTKPAHPALAFRGEGGPAQLRDIGDSLVVGRDEGCDLRLPDVPKLSRRHFVVRRNGSRFVLNDLGSRNGTTVEGTPGRISSRELRDGDIIHVGGLLFVFLQPV